MSIIRRAGLALCSALLAASVAGAQVTETSIAFDSAGKVRALTPSLVTRFDLRAPAWPVTGDFLEAKLYEISTGGHILAVERPDRRVERYPLTPDHVSALRFAIDAAMTLSGAAVTEERTDVASPARGAFVRNQMVLTWALYGPLLATISGDDKAGTALYLLAVSTSYFVTTGISRQGPITQAMNHLATDGALRGWGAASGILYSLAGDADSKAYSAIGLGGALGGTIAGFQAGRRMTDSEAQAATSVSNFAAVTAFGLAGTAGMVKDDASARPVVGAIVASGLAGYALGPSYPRRAKYTVTRGDIRVLSTGALLGLAVAVTPFVDSDVSPELGFGAATTGMLVGTYLAERHWVRAYDHSAWDAGQTTLGMAAGVLMGSALVVLTEPGPQVTMGLMTAGGLFGAIAGHKMADPARASTARTSQAPTRPNKNKRRVEFNVSASDLALSALGVPGRHSLVTLRF